MSGAGACTIPSLGALTLSRPSNPMGPRLPHVPEHYRTAKALPGGAWGLAPNTAPRIGLGSKVEEGWASGTSLRHAPFSETAPPVTPWCCCTRMMPVSAREDSV